MTGWEEAAGWVAPSLLVFFTVVLALAGAYSLAADVWLADGSRVSRRVDEEFLKRQRERAKNSSLFKDLGKLAAELAAEEGPRLNWRDRLDLTIEQAGLDFTRRLFAVTFCLGLAAATAAAAAPAIATRSPWQSVLAALAAGLVAAVLPLGYVWQKRKGRRPWGRFRRTIPTRSPRPCCPT